MHFESGMSPIGKATKHSLLKLRINFIHWARLSHFCLWARRLNWCGKIVPKGDTVRATKWPPCKKTDHVFVQWNQVWCLLENIRNGGGMNRMLGFLRDTFRATTWPPWKRLTTLYPLHWSGIRSIVFLKRKHFWWWLHESSTGIDDRFCNEAELMWPGTEQINFIRIGKQTPRESLDQFDISFCCGPTLIKFPLLSPLLGFLASSRRIL